MDDSKTVFYLVPLEHDRYATEIVWHPDNGDRRCASPCSDAPVSCLRIGLDQRLKSPPYLARFGRRDHNDVILPKRFSRNDQCYFNFNRETGELLLHDLSEKNDTELYDYDESIEPEKSQMWKTPRQCVVVLSPDLYYDTNDRRGHQRQWLFKIGRASFRLVPRRNEDDEAAFRQAKLTFANQTDHERTCEGTLERIIGLGLQSLYSETIGTTYRPPTGATFNPHNTRLRTPLEPEQNNVIRYTKLRPLGGGGQGVVHQVVDMHSGNHLACKIVAPKSEVPEWRIFSERDFKARVEMEVNLVQALRHENIVPYIHVQGFRIGQNIEIFMPVYEGSLDDLIQRKIQATQAVFDVLGTRQRITDTMLPQILDALNYVHSLNPPIIHRDIKTTNILFTGTRFFLTDFGVAKLADTSKTVVGTEWYLAPEIREQGNQTPKVDIYGLGVTVVECLAGLPAHKERLLHLGQYHQHLQSSLLEHAPQYASMLADVADQRPSARQLIHEISPQPIDSTFHRQSSMVAPPDLAISSTLRKTDETIMIESPTPMEWTRTNQVSQQENSPTLRNESIHEMQSQPPGNCQRVCRRKVCSAGLSNGNILGQNAADATGQCYPSLLGRKIGELKTRSGSREGDEGQAALFKLGYISRRWPWSVGSARIS